MSHSTSSSHASVAGLVASMDEHFTQYAANTTIQPPLREIIEEIDLMIEVSLLNHFTSYLHKIHGLSESTSELLRVLEEAGTTCPSTAHNYLQESLP